MNLSYITYTSNNEELVEVVMAAPLQKEYVNPSYVTSIEEMPMVAPSCGKRDFLCKNFGIFILLFIFYFTYLKLIE